MDVGAWLGGLGLERYVEIFAANAVGADVLPDLTDADLRELHIPLGDRKRLLKAAAALRLALAEAGPAGDAESANELPGERRQVTVLFADLAGYTALSRELDAEEVHALLGCFFERTDSIVAEYGGRVDKHLGDCAMAVFGAPVAHGNDAERAVRAALAIRDAMPTVGAEAGRSVAVHVGVAGGEVVASGTGSSTHREYTVTGDTVNLAARLTDAAQPGEILLSETVRRALLDRLDCEEVEALAVKGFADPVRAWRLHAVHAHAAMAWRPLVGRDAECAQFRAILAACTGSGSGRAVLLRGEAGIGKTRLWRSLHGLRPSGASPAIPASSSTSARAPVGTPSGPSCAGCSASTAVGTGPCWWKPPPGQPWPKASSVRPTPCSLTICST